MSGMPKKPTSSHEALLEQLLADMSGRTNEDILRTAL